MGVKDKERERGGGEVIKGWRGWVENDHFSVCESS